MEKIGHKMLAFILALCLIIPTSSVFAIDGEGIERVEPPQIEEIKEEAPAEEPAEEVKEEIKEEPQEVKEEVKEKSQEKIEEVKEESKEEPKEVKEEPLKISKNTIVTNSTTKDELTIHGVNIIRVDNQDENVPIHSTEESSIKTQTVSEGSTKQFYGISNNSKLSYGCERLYVTYTPLQETAQNGRKDTALILTSKDAEPIFYDEIPANKSIVKINYQGNGIVKIIYADEHTEELTDTKDIYLAPVYSQTPIVKLKYNYIDNISTGSGSWSNLNSFISITHTFSNPEFKSPNLTKDFYQFKYWKNDETEEYFYDGDSYTYTAPNGKVDTVINTYAYWQPAVKVNLYNGTELFDTKSSFESINSIDFDKLADTDTKQFIGWFDENGQIADIYNAPAITKENNSVLTINLFAKFKEIIPPQPDPEPEPTPEPIPTPGPAPEVKPTPEPVPEPTPGPTPVTPTKPTEPKKDNTVVKKQTTTTTATTTETYTETRVISPLPTPRAAESIVEESKTPLAKPQGTWALLNLILTIISCLIAIILLFVKKKSENDEYTDEEEKDICSMRRFKIFSILFGIVSIIVFIFTEDMTMSMVWVDRWTILMAIFTGIEIANIFIIRQKAQGKETEGEE